MPVVGRVLVGFLPLLLSSSVMPETQWVLRCWYPWGDFPTCGDLCEGSLLGGFVSAVSPFGVATVGVLSCWVVNFSRTLVIFLAPCLCRCRSTRSRVPGSCLSWIGLRFRSLHR